MSAGVGSVGSAILGTIIFNQPLNAVQAIFLAVITGDASTVVAARCNLAASYVALFL